MAGFTTRAMRADVDLGAARSVATPIFQTSTYAFDEAAQMTALIESAKDAGYVYSRWHNPTRGAMEQVVASLEGAESGVSFASGMAAISTTLLALTKPGDHAVSSPDLYGGTFSVMRGLLPRAGVETTVCADYRAETLMEAMRPSTRLCYVETIGNPLTSVPDLAALGAACSERGVQLVVDNTFASPYLCRPLELGASVVVHSATKYLGGHHDLTAGVVCGDRDGMTAVRELSIDLGGTAAPFDAWLVLRGLQTLALRMERHCSNALALASALSSMSGVSRVWYPGLASHPDCEVASRVLRAGSGMLAFDLVGGLEAGRAFLDSLQVALVGASLGGVHTLAVHPASVTHTQLAPEEREAIGITDGLIRVSVGIEDVDDLIADFTQAIS